MYGFIILLLPLKQYLLYYLLMLLMFNNYIKIMYKRKIETDVIRWMMYIFFFFFNLKKIQ